MKKLIVYSLLMCLFYITACDKIEPPYKNICLDQLACNFNGLLPCVYAEEGFECDSIAINNNKTILIEKFTGHKCSNCPDASRKIDELKEVYGNNIISVAIHPGGTQFTDTDENYSYDFTTDEGDEIMSNLGNQIGLQFGLPTASLNRISGGISNTRLWFKDDWSTQIYNLLYDGEGNLLSKNLDIKIFTQWNASSKQLNITTEINMLNDLDGNYKLAIIIIEDGIVSPQDDGEVTIEDYEHNHIYRCAVNTTFGEDVALQVGSLFSAENTVIFNTQTNDYWTDEWNNINNCSVIAYVYNSDTYVIEHTEKQHIIHE
tara:strand:+ start:2179 stop:3129 length:951 start_codon:yes stop_codon:yes gene_type:complete